MDELDATGGYLNYLLGTVSLKLVDGAQNGAQGTDYGAFLIACGVAPETSFFVTPTTGVSTGVNGLGVLAIALFNLIHPKLIDTNIESFKFGAVIGGSIAGAAIRFLY